MGIAEINPRQLAPSVGILGAGVMIPAVFSSLSNDSTTFGGQIQFGSIGLHPQPPTLLPATINIDREIDLMIGSFNFRIGSEGTTRLSDPICSGPSVKIPAPAATSTSSVGSSGEANSPRVIISSDSAESGRDLADLIDGISHDPESKDTSDTLLQDSSAEEAIGFDIISTNNSIISDEDLADLYDGVSYNPEDKWSPGLQLQDEDPTIVDSELDINTNPSTRKVYAYPVRRTNNVRFTHHQICAVIENASGAESEDFDSIGNPFVNPTDLTRGTGRQIAPKTGNSASGTGGPPTERVQVRIPVQAWDRAR
jgi:hypothetical protein